MPNVNRNLELERAAFVGHFGKPAGVSTLDMLHNAGEAARQRNHNYIGIEHAVLGSTNFPTVRPLLTSVGMDPDRVAREIEFIIGEGDPAFMPDTLLNTLRLNKVLGLSVIEAKKANSPEVRVEHVYLAIAQEGESVPAGIFGSYSTNYEKMQRAVIALGESSTS